MMKDVFDMQRKLNKKVLGFDILKIEKEEDRITWLRNYLTAYSQELSELLESLDLNLILDKKSEVIKPDIENIKIEIVDMLHFLVSMLQVLGEEELDENLLQGKPSNLDDYFLKLAMDYEKENTVSLVSSSVPYVFRNLIFLACNDFVSIASLLDCTAWKWWAKQEIKLEEAKKIIYEKIFPHWCMMTIASGMNASSVQQLYFKKNMLNVKRQEEGYKSGKYEKVGRDGIEDNRKLFEK